MLNRLGSERQGRLFPRAKWLPTFPKEVGQTASTITFSVSGMAYKARFELQLMFTGVTGAVVNCGFAVGFMQGQPVVVPILGSDFGEWTSDGPWTTGTNAFKSNSATHLKCTNC